MEFKNKYIFIATIYNLLKYKNSQKEHCEKIHYIRLKLIYSKKIIIFNKFKKKTAI